VTWCEQYGTTIASGSDDGTIKLWDVNTWTCRHTFQAHNNWVIAVAYSPDGSTIASSSNDGTIHVWDVNTGTCLHNFQAHSDWVNVVVYSPDGSTIASGSDDGTIKLWDVNTGTCLRTLSDRLCEGLQIAGAIGLNAAEKETLKALGAVDGEELQGE